MTLNDTFKAVTRYWDRITHSAQIIQSLPQAIAALLDPADCGPAFIALPQDTQELAFDCPEVLFAERLWQIPRRRADKSALARAFDLMKTAKKPLIIAGSGVRDSGAENAVAAFAAARGIPVAKTIAGKGGLTHDHPVHCGPIGIVGSTSANALAGEVDVIVVIGTRLQDFTTGSWTAFAHDAQFISINAARFDAVKHRALAVVGDALETAGELDAGLGDWRAPSGHLPHGKALFAEWNALLDSHQAVTNAPIPTYAQMIGILNKTARPNDTLIGAAGGTPGEITKGWRVTDPNTFDCEFGFSCMGYEIATGWDHAMAKGADGTPIVMLGDGTCMMMNADIYSTVLTGHKMIVVVRDNGGYAVISRLQQFKGVPGFNNLLKDCRIADKANPLHVDFVKHAEAIGALARKCESLADLEEAMIWAQGTDRTTVTSFTSVPHAGPRS